MKNTDADVSNEAQFESAFDRLEKLLREQLELARRGNISEVEVRAGRARELVERISGSEYFAKPQFQERRKGLERLYSQICLALSAQMDDVSQALGRIYKGRRTMMLYRDSV
jgi:hypothetical protein